jgi:hypothetical protein
MVQMGTYKLDFKGALVFEIIKAMQQCNRIDPAGYSKENFGIGRYHPIGCNVIENYFFKFTEHFQIIKKRA